MKHLTLFCFIAISSTASLHADDTKKEAPKVTETHVVESGTYKGKAHKVEPDEEEIYVKTSDGKILELYLRSDTAITKDGKKVKFDALKEGQDLEVEVEKNGQKLRPISVKILG